MGVLRWSPGLGGLAVNPALPARLVDVLVAAGDRELRARLAGRDVLSDAQVRSLAALDGDVAVVLAHRGLLRAEMVDGRDARVVVALFDASGAPAEWAHVHAAVEDPWVRTLLASAAHTPVEVVALLADDTDVDVVVGAAESRRMSAALAGRLARHPHTQVRHAVATNKATPGEVLAGLARDGGQPLAEVCPGCDGSDAGAPWWVCDGGSHEGAVNGIQGGTAGNPATPVAALVALARHPVASVRWTVAARAGLPQDEYARLATDPLAGVRGAVAANPAVDAAVLRGMVDDRTHDVRRCLLHNPNVPLDVLTDLAGAVRTGPDLLPRIAAASPGELRALSSSRNPAVRMLVARHPDLPDDLVDGLAADADAKVLHAIARNPRVSVARMEAMLAAHGARVVGALASNPACPADVLVRIATLRPSTRLAYREIARHPNATAAALDACLQDARARVVAARHPALDPGTLLVLLDDPDEDVVTAAAANPALPLEVMEGLVRRAGPSCRCP